MRRDGSGSRNSRVAVLVSALVLALVLALATVTLASCGGLPTNHDVGQSTPTHTSSPIPSDSYIVGRISYGNYQRMTLNTIASWNGTESKDIKFKVTKPPSVVNWGISSYHSQIATSLEVWITDSNGVTNLGNGIAYGDYYIMDEVDTYTISIKAVGVSYWVRIGVENGTLTNQ